MNHLKQDSVRRMAGAIGLLAWGLAAVASAQTPGSQRGEAAAELDAVVVTGTHIRGAQPTGNKVLVIDRVQLQASGKATLGDFLRDMPSNFAGGVGMSDNSQGGQDASVAGSNMTGGQGLNLRGLGALSTLVLVNGRRVAAAGQYGDFVDISTIPTHAVSHIEVLLDGASAVYGSDAVGGVVNIILKRSDAGAHSMARIGGATQGGGSQVQLGHSWGTGWEGGGLILGYEYNRKGPVSAGDREIFNGGDFSSRGGVNWRQRTARAGAAANLFEGTATGHGQVIWRVPGGAGVGLTEADLIAVGDGVGTTYNAWEGVDLLPEMTHHSAFFGFEHEIGPGAELHGDVRYGHRRGTYNQGYLALYGTLGPDNPYVIPGVANNYGVLIDERQLRRKVGADSLAVNLGASFDLGERWHGGANLSYSREAQFRNSDVQRNANIYDHLITANGSRIQAPTSIQCSQGLPTRASAAAHAYCAARGYVPFNPWTTEALPDAVLAQVIGYENLNFTSWLAQGSFTVDGEWFQTRGGTAKLAAGIDYRREHIGGDLDFNWRSIDARQETFGSTERDVAALFAELAIPLIGPDNEKPLARQLDVSIAGRYERGQGLGDFSTFNPKFGIDFKPIDSLTLRGSWGTSFHAPPMRYAYNGVQPISGGNGAFMRADLYNAPCDTAMIPLNGVTGTPGGSGNCSFTALVISGGAGPSLKPEEATTWTLGVDWQPESVPGLSLGASYFNLKIDERIVRIQAGALGGILAQLFATGSSPYSESLELNPDPARVWQIIANDPRYLGQLGAGPVQGPDEVAMIINATQINLAALKMKGLDFNVSYAFETADAGDFELFLRGTWLDSYRIQAAPGMDFVDQLGHYSATGNPVPLRSLQGLRWRRGPVDASLTMNYVDSYACVSGCFEPGTHGVPMPIRRPRRIDAWKTFDLSLGYEFAASRGLLSDARLSFSVVNLTDRNPPFVDGGTAANDVLADPYDPANATAFGRILALTFGKRW